MNESVSQLFSFSEPAGNIYNVDYSTLDFGDAPFKGMMGQINPGESSRIHNHFEIEIFLFLSGTGVIKMGEQHIDIVEGTSVRVPPFISHVIKNSSETDPLRFLSFYWSGKLTELPINDIRKDNTTLIFSTPPTPNGDMHLGHLSGPYLAADIYRRYLEQTGLTALHVTGRDDHQTYIAKKAKIENLHPKQMADIYSDQIRRTLNDCGIHIDYFIEPNREGKYAHFIKKVFNELHEKGYIIAKTEMAAFSAQDNRYLHEAYISGKCPYCHGDSDGNACEECGRPNSCVDLLHAYDKQNNQAPILRPVKRLYFSMSLCAKQLDEYIKTTSMSAHALALSQAMLADGLPDICVSHPSEWGIQVPVPGFEDQTIYVWFEMAAAYLWGVTQVVTEEISDIEKFNQFYNENTKRVVHFYGFDNTYYHTLLFPAFYFALGLSKPPCAHVVNELLDLNGSKFSTSRDHAIWGRDLVTKVSVDHMRWFLSEIRPEGIRADFTLSKFTQTINHMFYNTLRNWALQLSALLHDKFNDAIPEPGAWTTEHQQFLRFILSCRDAALNYYTVETFSPRGVVRALTNLAEAAFTFTSSQASFNTKSVNDYLRTAVALSAFALKLFSLISKPIIPLTANHLLQSIGVPEDTQLTESDFIAPGTLFNQSLLPSFQRINEDDLATMMDK